VGDLVVLTAVELEAAPSVPEGLLSMAMYPKSPWDSFPQRSLGYPGHGELHLPVDCWLAGT
jgi:hypothetical protein